MNRPVLLTLGHGYSAAALAASLAPGWRVMGTTRSGGKAAKMAGDGVEPIDWADSGAVDRAIAAASHILVSLPPQEAGDPVLARHGDALAAAKPEWVGYLSTTGVYGDRQGGWVDEEGEIVPVNERSHRRAVAEREWLATDLPVHIFRIAGIYGPGRNALVRARTGRARRIVKAGQIFSRIHLADLVHVLRASIGNPRPGRAYNVADDEPAPPQDVVVYAAELLGLPEPPVIPFEEAELTPMARSFYVESKKVSNRRIREELGIKLLYPNYRLGLSALLEAEK